MAKYFPAMFSPHGWKIYFLSILVELCPNPMWQSTQKNMHYTNIIWHTSTQKNETGQPYFAYLLAPRGIEDRFLAFAFFGVADLDHMSFIAPKK